MNTQQQVLNLLSKNGGTATREQICQLIEFTKPNVVRKYGTNLCYILVSKGFMKPVVGTPKRGKATLFVLTPSGRDYIKTGQRYGDNGTKSIVTKRTNPRQFKKASQTTPVEKLISGSIIRDLLLSKFDQLSASERCGLLEIYNIVESKTKTQQQ